MKWVKALVVMYDYYIFNCHITAIELEQQII